MRNVFVALAIIFAVMSTSCGSASVTPEDFMRRYNANLADFKGLNFDRLKIDYLTVRGDKIYFHNNNFPDRPLNGVWTITATCDKNSKNIRRLFVGSNFMAASRSLLAVYAIIAHSLDSDKKISEPEGVELVKFFQDLIPDTGNTAEKTFNGKTYKLAVDTTDGTIILTIDNK